MKPISTSIDPAMLSSRVVGLSQDLMRIPRLDAMQTGKGRGVDYRFLKITEISEEKPGTYQRAMANVFAVMQGRTDSRLVYLLRGTREHVSLSLGVVVPGGSPDDLHEAKKNLRSAMQGHLAGVQFSDVLIDESLDAYRHFGVAFGVPTAHEDDAKEDEDDFQGVERRGCAEFCVNGISVYA